MGKQIDDWQYSHIRRQWELTDQGYQAIVVRAGLNDSWYATVERLNYYERHEGPGFDWPHDGRAWCEAEIKRLLTSKAG